MESFGVTKETHLGFVLGGKGLEDGVWAKGIYKARSLWGVRFSRTKQMDVVGIFLVPVLLYLGQVCILPTMYILPTKKRLY